ncbi:hypothetical protein HF086_005393 [Spodoptera exigua]|uniref:DUF5641 domain-containing protein n=1 Tax=Spodoptera exigua TaxID=7107 RepID=A0A922M2F2_SPOEX|nr:hypothetical protein HF086_005393 [Spodoptera exigua]
MNPTTIPRLELCGALLGARLCSKVLDSLQCNISRKVLWSDSMVVLGWVQTPPRDLKVFVCNRVNEINILTPGFDFRYVPTDQNPADMGSRGVSPKQLKASSLWWAGPSFLANDPTCWPTQQQIPSLPELKIPPNIECYTTIVNNIIEFEKYSNFNKLIRIYAYVQRFVHNCLNKNSRISEPLDVKELDKSLLTLVRQEHERLFHAGPQHLLASIRERFWAIGGRNLARSTTKKCLLCARFRGKTIQPIMGNLPSERTYSMFPFYTCGVDFAGPFTISSRKGRGSQSSKCYLCLFVCLSTKAIHLELVSSLSSDAFILSLKRFISRRGKPSVIYCDNGTNFRGANNEMSRVLRSNQKIRQDFWQRWRREFVAELQQRTKWKTRQHELRVGDLVILKEENVPPLQWRLGRVTRLYPGTDGVSRVADVMSSRGIVRRAVNKMCILPSSAPADTTLINDVKDAAENKEA